MSDYTALRDLFANIEAEYEVPNRHDDSDFQFQIASGDAPKGTRQALRLATTWFFFNRDGRFLGYGYAGYDEEQHFTARVQHAALPPSHRHSARTN